MPLTASQLETGFLAGTHQGLRVLAVDDERLALDDLATLLRLESGVSEVMTASSSFAALRMLSHETVDALFLDVRMPELDGLDLARIVRRFVAPPALVLVSAYESPVVHARELGAADYLMKPVASGRLAEALKRVCLVAAGPAVTIGLTGRKRVVETGSDVISVDLPRGGVRLLDRSTVLYLQAYGDYQRVYSTEGRFLLRARMATVEEGWAAAGFIRVHRQFIVNLRRATSVRRHPAGGLRVTFAGGTEVPVARSRVAALRQRLGSL